MTNRRKSKPGFKSEVRIEYTEEEEPVDALKTKSLGVVPGGGSYEGTVTSNDAFNLAESFLLRLVIFLIFVVGLAKVCWDTLKKILR